MRLAREYFVIWAKKATKHIRKGGISDCLKHYNTGLLCINRDPEEKSSYKHWTIQEQEEESHKQKRKKTVQSSRIWS